MGLAASQARFLGLTARKSNTEYEGQQVNQQRTALANESASLYSQLTNLSVPTPPDITNYYQTEYSFDYNGTTYTMESLPVREGDGYTIALSHSEKTAGYKAITDLSGIEIPETISAIDLKDLSSLKNHLTKTNVELADGATSVGVFTYNKNTYYQVPTKGQDGKTAYAYYQYNANQNTVSKSFANCKLEYTSTGDISTINVPGLTEGQPIAVQTNQVANEDEYDLAMSAYQKEYNEYEKTMAQINAKTEVLQQQDKTLELRLNQLDTEQSAISTEMDAVKKVIDKNVESTFKTFA